MSRTGKITLFFGDAEHPFRIGVGEAEELDELFGHGLLPIRQRILELHVPTICQVLRVGLTGAGMPPEKAARRVNRHVRDGYYLEAAEVADKVVEAAVKGVPDDMPGEPQGEGTQTNASPSPTAD